MQNKGLVKVLAVLLTLCCVYCLSFSFVTRHYENLAKEYAKGDSQKEKEYLDSLANEKVYLGLADLKYCRERGLNLGLDLKGGMNVILEVSVPDVIKTLSGNKNDETFNKALGVAAKEAKTSQTDFITLFVKEYKKLAPESHLASLFATGDLKDQINPNSSDSEVEKVLRAKVKDAVQNSFNILRARIDHFGVVQPNIQSLEDKMGRIMIELPGIKEPERVRKLLQGSANLEFWETYNAKDVMPILVSADAKLHDILTDTAASDSASVAPETETAEGDSLAADSTKNEVASLLADKKDEQKQLDEFKKLHPLLSLTNSAGVGERGPVVGYASPRDTATINRYLAMPEVAVLLPRDLKLGWGVAPIQGRNKEQIFELYALKAHRGGAILGGDVIKSAKDDFDQYGNPAVSMSMTTTASRDWAQITKNNIGKSIAIVLDGYIYSAPNVNGEITGGNSQISGHFTPEEAKDLANVLSTGKMPAPAHIVQEDIVGPSLGQASINAGVMSFVVALIILMIYMCVMYGVIPGMIANSALILNMLFTLGILSSFGAALTMSGIAGMVLSLGMAVDANVLIYERTKEELRAGKGVKMALADGYSNAFSAIFDSNLTSIITGIILFNFGTGPIRGFATTLIIGILVSFFTAVFMTRLVYEHFMAKNKWQGLTFCTSVSKNLMANVNFNFMGRSKTWLTTALVIILICVGFLATRGLSKSIDFTGGRNFYVQFENPVQPEQVRELIAKQFGDANVTVIAIGTDKKNVRISTNYRINDEGNEVDTEIEENLYKALKPLLTNNITLGTFIDRENRTGGSIISSQKVGPSIADDIKVSAIYSVILALIAIGLYILIRFHNIAYSIGSVVALTCDTVIILGAYAICWGWMPFSLEIDQTFIGAILTAIGYSINDKVVIFDRVREYFGLYPKRERKQLFNDSLNSTLARTINTSVSTLIVLVCILLLGGDSIRSFAFAMILGVVFGTLSSLFVASPVAYLCMGKDKAAKA